MSVLRVAFSGYEDRGHDFRARALRRSRADALGARWSAGPTPRGKASLASVSLWCLPAAPGGGENHRARGPVGKAGLWRCHASRMKPAVSSLRMTRECRGAI